MINEYIQSTITYSPLRTSPSGIILQFEGSLMLCRSCTWVSCAWWSIRRDSKEAMFGAPKSVPPWTLAPLMPPKARTTRPPNSTNTTNTTTRKTTPHQAQQDDPPFPVDNDQGGAQEAGPSRVNRNHRIISSLEVADEGSRGDAQAIIDKIAALEAQNCKLLLSMSASQTGCFALLTILSPRTCEKGKRTSQGQLWQCPPTTDNSRDPLPSRSPWAQYEGQEGQDIKRVQHRRRHAVPHPTSV